MFHSPPSKSSQSPVKKQLKVEKRTDDYSSSGDDADSSSSSGDDADSSYGEDEEYHVNIEGDDSEPPVAVLNDSVAIAESLIEKNLILIPFPNLGDLVNMKNCPTINGSGDGKPLLYAVVKLDNNELYIEKLAGATTHGKKRAGFLDEQGLYGKGSLPIILFHMNNIDQITNDDLVRAVKKLCKDNCTIAEGDLDQMTIQSAIDLQEQSGISFFFDLLMYYINHRDGFRLRGLMKRLTIHVIESGYQEYARKLDCLQMVEGAMACIQHEFLGGSYLLKKTAETMKKVANDLNGMLKELGEKYGEKFVEYLRSESITMKAKSSWGPDIDCLGLTVTINDVAFGEENWSDAYPGNPCKKGDGDVYDTSKFSDEDHEEAKNSVEEFVESMKSNGKVGALDSNKCVFDYMGTTAKDFLEEEGWDLIYEFDGDDLIVYGYKDNEWKRPAILILHGPPCAIMNSDPNVAVDERLLNTSRKRGYGMTVVDEFAKFLATDNAQDIFSEEMEDYKILGNITVMQSMIEYLVVHLHYYRMGASVIAKDLRVDFNVLSEEYTGLLLNEEPSLTKKDPSQQKDAHIGDKLRCLLARKHLGEEEADQIIRDAVELIRKNGAPVLLGTERNNQQRNNVLNSAWREIGLNKRIFREMKRILERENNERIENERIEIERREVALNEARSNRFNAIAARFKLSKK